MFLNNIGDYRNAVRELIDFSSWCNPVAINLTFRQCIWYEPSYRVWIDEIAASQDINYLSNVINSKLLTRNERRRGDRLGFFAVLEGAEKTRLHDHAVVECPEPARTTFLAGLSATPETQTHWAIGRAPGRGKVCTGDE